MPSLSQREKTLPQSKLHSVVIRLCGPTNLSVKESKNQKAFFSAFAFLSAASACLRWPRWSSVAKSKQSAHMALFLITIH